MTERKISEVQITNVHFGNEAGEDFANADVYFRRAEGSSEVLVRIGTSISPSTSVEDLRIALAKEALVLLADAAAVDVEKLLEFIREGSRSCKDL